MGAKPKLALYWAAGCGGCEIAVANLDEKILSVIEHFDFMFCPCLLDTKKTDIEAMPDQSILITLFNGAIRSEENEEMAHLLRKKSQILIAFGACSAGGGIPGLANLSGMSDMFRTVYLDSPTLDNPSNVVPQPSTRMPEGEITIPGMLERVRTLAQVVLVDYSIPGCPPEPKQIWNVIEAVVHALAGGPALPPPGSVIGAGRKSVCDECEKTKEDKTINRLRRFHEFVPDPKRCLLEQGVVCMGIATRDGCGALCPTVNMPCTGCYGAPEGVLDQGAKMVAALGSILDIDDAKSGPEDSATGKTEDRMAGVKDYAGLFYKYSLPGSLLRGKSQ